VIAGSAVETAVRRSVKIAALPFGVPARRRADDLVILLYHRIGDDGDEIVLPRATFDRQLRELAGLGPVLHLSDAVGGSRGGIVISVDDGYRDFAQEVVPRLVEHGFPAILYLATSLVSGDPREGDRLGWPDLRDAVGTGLVTVGAHTHGHVDLSRATEREAEDEMRRSKELIEDRLGAACVDFAYPWGVASPDARRVAERLFQTAALPAWRTNRAGRLDRHALGRTPVLRSDGILFFRAKARGMLNAEALAYRALGRGPWGRA
jgi:peptidoglycan/xylan/chitin deacetylase (PgdA/CDA1 family)